ncbi:hypothetical protein D3C77_668120 [compost metagenome]
MLIRLIPQSAIFVDAFSKNSFRHSDGNLLDAIQQSGIILQHFCRLHEKPASFDVMAIRNMSALYIPLLIEEEMKMSVTRIDDVVQRNLDQLSQLQF